MSSTTNLTSSTRAKAVWKALCCRRPCTGSVATELGARTTTRFAGVLYGLAAGLCFVLPAPGWVVGLLGLGYVANTLKFWNVTDATSAAVNRAWRVFLWLNYVTGAVVTISVLSNVLGFST